MPIHAEHKDPISANAQFLATITLQSQLLHELQSNSMQYIPERALATFNAIMLDTARAITKDLANADTPVTLLLCIPRLILAPPPPNTERAHWPSLIRSRALRLRNGEGAKLWKATNPLSKAPPNVIAVTPPESYSKMVNDTARWGSIPSVFKAISKIPFAPSTQQVKTLILEKILTEPIQYDHAILQRCAELLPPVNGGASYCTLADRIEGNRRWQRRAARMPTNGQPDGTGLRITHFTASTDILAAYAPWFEAILRHQTTPGLRAFLRSSLARAQCKQQNTTDELGNRTKAYPKTAAEITKVRPLKTHNIIRRIVFGHDARILANQQRTELESYGQYGMSPDGCSAAARKMQLCRDLLPSWTHAMSDGINAYGNLHRPYTAQILDARARAPNASHAAVRQRDHFFAFYVESHGDFYVQVGTELHRHEQHDGIDQGDTHGNLIYNLSTTIGVHPSVATAFQPNSRAIIHDDTTIAAPTTTYSQHPPPRNFEEAKTLSINLANAAAYAGSPFIANPTPSPTHPHKLPFAAIVFAYFLHLMENGPRVPFEVDKTLIFAAFTTGDDSPERPLRDATNTDIFPAGTTLTTTAYRIAGCYVYNLPHHAHEALAEVRASNDKLVHTFMAIDRLNKYIAIRAIAVCCRPTAKYNHHFRGHPPSISLPHAQASRATYLTAITTLFGISRRSLEMDPTSEKQLFLPAAQGGTEVPCPVMLIAPCFTGSVIDTLGMIAADPIIKPLILDTSEWPTSPSATLSEFAAHFKDLTDKPCFRIEPDTDPSTLSRFRRTLLNPNTNTFTLDRAAQAANMHSQHALSATIFKTALAEMLTAPPAAAPNAPARLRACAQPGATTLFTTMSVDKDNSLTDLQATFLLCNH